MSYYEDTVDKAMDLGEGEILEIRCRTREEAERIRQGFYRVKRRMPKKLSDDLFISRNYKSGWIIILLKASANPSPKVRKYNE